MLPTKEELKAAYFRGWHQGFKADVRHVDFIEDVDVTALGMNQREQALTSEHQRGFREGKSDARHAMKTRGML